MSLFSSLLGHDSTSSTQYIFRYFAVIIAFWSRCYTSRFCFFFSYRVFVACLYVWGSKPQKNFALLIGGMILPMIFILVLFIDANNTITGQTHSDIYAHLRHPHHYIPSEYTGYYIIPWPVSFGACCLFS